MNQEELNKEHERCIQSDRWILLLISLFGIVVLIAGVFFLPPHWLQIVSGTIAFVIGSAGLLLTEAWKNHELLRWVRVIFLPVILAVGGFFTTYGWNTRDNYLRDRALLIAMGSEWLINKTYIHVQSERRNVYLSEGGHLSTPIYTLPTAREARQTLTQVTFIRSDKSLIRALTVYVMAIDRLVSLCENIDRLCSQPIATMQMKKTFVEMNLGDGKDNAFQYFIKAHKKLEDVLLSNYPWSLEEAETRVDKELLDAIEGTRLILAPNSNRPK